jgi:uncharacterized protein YkwD
VKGQVLSATALTLIVFTNAKWTHDDDNRLFELFDQSLTRRHFLDRYLSLRQRENPEFTEAQEKFQNDALDTHNILRAQHCVPLLTLDDTINTRAQAYAEYLASNDSTLIHSTDRNGQLGENLYAVTRADPITNPNGMYSSIFQSKNIMLFLIIAYS